MVTHSLLSSWLYTLKENPYDDATTEADPMEDFMKVLRREPRETTEAMQNGIEFENLVTDIVSGKFAPAFSSDGSVNQSSYGDGEVMGYTKYPRWYDAATRIADIVRGGILQYKARKEVSVRGTTVLLYGVLDVLKAGEIYDIKFSKSYSRGKYFDSTQHPMYFELVPEATEFTYLVSNGSDLNRETYRREETPGILRDVSDFFSWLEDAKLMDLYREKWIAL